MINPKILIAAAIYPPDAGGPAIHAKKQFEYFKQQGLKTEVVALAHLRQYPKVVRHLIYLFKLLIKAPNYDIVYAHDAVGSGIPALLAARLWSKKCVVRVGGDLAWEREADSPQALSMLNWYKEGKHIGNKSYEFSHWLLKRADLVIVPTHLLTNVYTKYYGVSDSKIKVISNPVPSTNGVENEVTQKIIFAGRLVAYKNLEFVIRNLKDILISHPELRFVIIGDGPERSRLESEVRELGLGSQVEFKGLVPQQQVLEELATSLFAVAPALTEFNPNYILEAISSHKPFLISREQGFNFTIPVEYTFDPLNGEELKDKVLNLLDHDGYEKANSWVSGLRLDQSWDKNLSENLNYLTQI